MYQTNIKINRTYYDLKMRITFWSRENCNFKRENKFSNLTLLNFTKRNNNFRKETTDRKRF